MTQQERERQDVLDLASRLVSQLEAMAAGARKGSEAWRSLADAVASVAVGSEATPTEFAAALKVKFSASVHGVRAEYYASQASRMADILLEEFSGEEEPVYVGVEE